LLVGNPVTGYSAVGPFADEATAVEVGRNDNEEWYVMALQLPPEEFREPRLRKKA